MRTNLKNARKKADMTQQQVSDTIDIQIRHYKALESGTRLGSIAVWDKLEDLFKISQRVLRENI